jgi:hypothetical protein
MTFKFRQAYFFCMILFLFKRVTGFNKYEERSWVTFKINKVETNRTSYVFSHSSLEEKFMHGNSSKIYGNSSFLNYYFINIHVGQPPKTQALILDTGSHQLVFPCQPLCNKCGSHLNSYYNLTESNTSSIIECLSTECEYFHNKGCSENKQCSFSTVYFNYNNLSRLMVKVQQFQEYMLKILFYLGILFMISQYLCCLLDA